MLSAGDNARYVAGLDGLFCNQGADALSHMLSSGMNQGLAPWQVAGLIETTPAAHLQLIQQTYHTVMGRQADPLAVSVWLPYLNAGGPVEGLKAALFSSPEYFQDHGGTQGFLKGLCEDAMHQGPDPSTEALLDPLMTNGLVRFVTAEAVLTSPQARLIELGEDYQQVLGRAPDSGSIAWMAWFAAGATSEQVRMGIAGSPEAFHRLVTMADQPPTITLYSPASGVTVSTNVAVTGKVIGMLSAPASLFAQVDGGGLVPVSFDSDGRFQFTPALPLDGSANGPHTVRFLADDAAGNRGTAALSFVLAAGAAPVDTQPPVIALVTPSAGQVINHNLMVTGQVGDDLTGVAALQAAVDAGPFVAEPVDASGNFHFGTALPLDGSADGAHTVRLRATDGAGNTSGLTSLSFTLDSQPPAVVIDGPNPGLTINRNLTVTGQVSDSGTGVSVLDAWMDSGAPAPVPFDIAGHFQFTTALALDGSANGPHTIHFQATDAAGNESSVADLAFTLDTTAVPDPGAVAPPLTTTTTTSFADQTSFLYTGSSPIQTGVAAGTIAVQQAAVLRGQVTDQAGAPVSGVSISVLDHPEFGSTRTRDDGMFDLAVNGGGSLTVVYDKTGYLEVQRQIDNVPWQDYAWLPTVVLIPMDSKVTAIDLTSRVPEQVAQGSTETDSDGTREATLLFPQGTTATMTLPDGSTQPLTTLHIHATEYTVGASGPDAMPAPLPATNTYTYAVNLSADEATAAGATQVTFSQPLPFYVENFLHMPVGTLVPVGYYDQQRGEWVASDNGRVIAVLSVTGGLADLDIDGSGTAAGATALAALGITDAERAQLASLYAPGQQLWRVPVSHFSPWDLNWPYIPPDDASPPILPPPTPPTPPKGPSDPSDPCSGIDPLGGVVDPPLPVAGTPFTLNYSSDRTTAFNNILVIPLTGASVPADLAEVDLRITVAGREFTQTFSPSPNQSYTFVWDGKDPYGRTVQGAQPVSVLVSYGYHATYGAIQNNVQFKAFGNYSPLTASDRTRQLIFLGQTWKGTLVGGWDARGASLGGWTLDVQQQYDPAARELYQGDGERRSAQAQSTNVITTVAGDGSLGSFNGDGIPATQARIYPGGVAVGPDGSFYIADSVVRRVRRVGPDGDHHHRRRQRHPGLRRRRRPGHRGATQLPPECRRGA